jgi:hypothetical protein
LALQNPFPLPKARLPTFPLLHSTWTIYIP